MEKTDRFGPLIHRINGDAISEIRGRFLVSCPYMGSIHKGGLFLLDFAANECLCICADDCRGIVRYRAGYLVATRLDGLIEIDAQFNPVTRHAAPDLDLHGMRTHADGRTLLAETRHNRVGIYSPGRFERIGEIVASESGADVNHINDFALHDDKLLLSMFALEGEWRDNLRNNRWAGAIVQYDLASGVKEKVLYSGLHMPHTLLVSEDSILYCESDEFRVKCEETTLCQLNGHTRGLARYGPYLLVGQSRVRSFELRREKCLHASLDAGIHIVHLETLLTRFVPMPMTQVYDIMAVDPWVDEERGRAKLRSLW